MSTSRHLEDLQLYVDELEEKMTTDIVTITELKEKLKRAEYIRIQQLQFIQKLQEEKIELETEIQRLNSLVGYT